jgi:hypothetical protein
MADRLLSQADVDELVSSLSRHEPARPAAPRPPENKQPAAAPPAAPHPVENVRPPVPRPVEIVKPAAAVPPVTRAPGAPAANPISIPAAPIPKPWMANRPNPAPAPVRAPEPAADVEARLAEMSRQLSQLNATMLRLELLEKKVSGLEARPAQSPAGSASTQQIQQLSEKLKKILINLKDTPGYAIRSHFDCDQCHDQGHVAVMFRCTNCGHERWYGWWPDKAGE